MNIEMIVDHLKTYNEKEIFYKEYYTQKLNPLKFNEFLQSLDIQDIIKRELVVPELTIQSIPTLMLNEDYFDMEKKKNVYLSKHNRYTPAFEHTHTFFEIIYVLSGSCHHNIFGSESIMHEGDLCMISPSVVHSIFVDDDSLIINLLIRSTTIEDIFFNILRGDSVVSDFLVNSIYLKNYGTYLMFHTYQDDDIKKQILDMYLEEFEEDEYTDRIITSMLMIFFTKLVRRYQKTAEFPASRKASANDTSMLFRFILKNYATITLVSLADELNYSVQYCSKYIKDTTGYNFTQILKKVRFQKAERFLISSSMSISKISELIGYENPENFIRAFKQEYHMSPTQFRSNNKTLQNLLPSNLPH